MNLQAVVGGIERLASVAAVDEACARTAALLKSAKQHDQLSEVPDLEKVMDLLLARRNELTRQPVTA